MIAALRTLIARWFGPPLASNEAPMAKTKELGLFLVTQQGDHQIVMQQGG